jgi:hypothetical protein
LWVKFARPRLLDLGVNSTSPANLVAGANAVSYAQFPTHYSAYRLLNQLGMANARAVRMLDAEFGRWVVAEFQNGRLIGNDFPIPTVAVLILEMAGPVSNFTPQSP